ncbi:MAG: YibE/F family protein [Oscillospiraceae bacterium]|nr:YibE/F family protein [Oscillospiraceae bacterium]
MDKPRRGLYIVCVPALLLCVLLSSCAPEAVSLSGEELWDQVMEEQRAIPARVLSIDLDEWSEDEGSEIHTMLFTAEITQGPLKGTRVPGRLVEYTLMGYRAAPLRAGSRVYLQPAMDENGPLGEFADYDRTLSVAFVIALFAVVLCLVGGMKGFRSLVALIVTCLGLAFIFIPMVRGGSSPIGAALLVCTIVTVLSLSIIGGVGVKTVASMLGILTGVATAGILTLIMQAAMRLTGLVDNEAIRLAQMPGMEQLNMNGLMFAAILIGALGAAMDVAVSLASALEELNRKGGLFGLELMWSGMKIGRDVMGTMSNTLVLAYAGGSLHLVMLLAADMSQFGYMISWELLATEILRAMAGSIGLVVIVPATSLISALMYRRPGTSENPFS